jgi:hypothetical protein
MVVLGSLAWLVACGPGPGAPVAASVDDLPVPRYQWYRESTLCTRQVVIDGQARSWEKIGCEGHQSGLVSRDQLQPDVLTQLAGAFAQLPAPGTEAPACGPDDSAESLTLTDQDGDRSWSFCSQGGPGGVGKGTDYPDEFRAAVELMDQLVPVE